jgi:hypothetical protein
VNNTRILKLINIEEGEFKNNYMCGFGRRMSSNGYYSVGFMKNGLNHGFAKVIK